jgi:hypothetical protein
MVYHGLFMDYQGIQSPSPHLVTRYFSLVKSDTPTRSGHTLFVRGCLVTGVQISMWQSSSVNCTEVFDVTLFICRMRGAMELDSGHRITCRKSFEN